MADIEETQRRIASALSRIDAGVEALQVRAATQVDPAAHAALHAALEEEKRLSAQAEARRAEQAAQHEAALRDLRAALEETEARAMAAEAAASSGAEGGAETVPQDMRAMEAELDRLKATVAQLRETVAALREAQEAGVADPQILNRSLVAELDALRAERAAEVAETTAILAALEPLLGDQPADRKEGA